jgi:hypothetical protein
MVRESLKRESMKRDTRNQVESPNPLYGKPQESSEKALTNRLPSEDFEV